MLKVDRLVDAVATLIVEEPHSPSTSTIWAWDEGHLSPKVRVSPKWTRVVEGNIYWEVTPFITMLNIFSF